MPVDVRDQHIVGQLDGKPSSPVEIGLGEHHVPSRRLQPAGKEEAGGLVASRGLMGQRVPYPRCPGGAVSEDHPGPAEAVGDAHAELGIVGEAPGQREVDVGPLGSRKRQAGRLPIAAYLRVTPGSGFGVPGGMRGCRDIGLSRLAEPRGGVRPDAVEQPVTHLIALHRVDAEQ